MNSISILFTNFLVLFSTLNLTLAATSSFILIKGKLDKNNTRFTISNQTLTIPADGNFHLNLSKNLCEGITELVIDSTIMFEMNQKLLNNFSNLLHLKIDKTQLKYINPEVLGQLTNLISFSAPNNFIEIIYPKTFQRLKNLKYWDLHSNKISQIDPLEFKNSKIEKIELWDNPCVINAEVDVINLPKILKNCVKNEIIFCDYFQKTLESEEKSFYNCYATTKDFGVEKSKIIGSHFDNKIDNDVKGLEIHSNFTKIPKIFKNFENLEILEISAQIKTLEMEDMKIFPNLRVLKLKNNQISAIYSDTFRHNPNLKFIDLTSNHLSLIGVGTFSNLKNLTLRLENNFCEIDNEKVEGELNLGKCKHVDSIHCT
jgi:hypothetical protein